MARHPASPASNGDNGRGAAGANGFHVTVEEDDVTLRLRLVGEFDLSSVAYVEAALGRLCALTRHVVFDLREVSFLDLAGLTTLIKADERSHTGAFDVQIIPPTGLASRVFTLTRAGTALTMRE